MGKLDKKKLRVAFRDAVFERDGYRCRVCGEGSTKLDAHHITDRKLMISGGYVEANGITLCEECHRLAEKFHETGVSEPGYSPEELYEKAASSYEEAVKASERLSK